MRLSKQPFSNLLKNPTNYSKLNTYDLIEEMNLYNIKRSGQPTYLPLGENLFNKLEDLLKDFALGQDFEKVHYPLLVPTELIKSRNNVEDFYSQIYFTEDKLFTISPTTEDLSIELLLNQKLSYKQLPKKWFSMQDVLRNIHRSERFMKTKQIRCLSMISFSSEEDSYKIEKYFGENFDNILNNFNINSKKIKFREEGTEYLYFCEKGEKKIDGKEATSLGMVYRLNIDMNNKINYTTSNNIEKEVSILTFGIGLQRYLFATIDSNRDEKGINFPDKIKPFKYFIILHRGESELAEKCYRFLRDKKIDVALDDREHLNFKEKASYSDFLGVPNKIIIGKNSNAENLEIKTRDGQIFYKSLTRLLE